MKKIVKYTTAQDDDPRGLDKRVTNLIDMGYQPFGGPYSAYNGRSVTLCQALVKYEGDEDTTEESTHTEPPVAQPAQASTGKSETPSLKIKPSAQPRVPPPPPAQPAPPAEPPTVFVEPLD